MIGRKVILGAAAVAAGAFFTLGTPTIVGAAPAATLGPQAGLQADSAESGVVILAKKGKGKHHHHHRHWGPAIGGAIVLGLGYCAIQQERCAEAYGEDTYRYWRCVGRAGCGAYGGDDDED